MKKKPKSIRIAEWNKTMKYFTSKKEQVVRLRQVSSETVYSNEAYKSDLAYWNNQIQSHISVKPN